ncbi:MAG: Sua5/YciO/YrdC/YwlC family protein, partial [Phycisphaeraceae bacterium]|nr:Sua5/YciO/YrdC/YwlC family protein [Phycisphaeraceae bacterium]
MEVVLPPDNNPQEMALALQQATQALQQGKLVAFPTETVYGIGAVATHDKGYKKLV